MEERLPDVSYVPTVPTLIRRAVERYGDNEFVVVGDRRVSFRDAERLSREFGLRLLAHGVGKGARVGILLPTGIEFVIAWLAAARIGALSSLLPATYRPAELRRALAMGDVSILIAPKQMLDKDYEAFIEEALPALATHEAGPIFDADAPHLRSVWILGGKERAWATDSADASGDARVDTRIFEAVEASVTPADLLVVIFTSGTSAEPKAVVHTHGAGIRKIQPDLGMTLPGSFGGRVFCAMPFFWIGGVQLLLGALHSGATVVAQPKFEPHELLDLMAREKCTSVIGWPGLVDHLRDYPIPDGLDLESLLYTPVNYSSRGHPRNLGMTETFGPHRNPEWFDYRVVDPASGSLLPDSEEGEFCVRGFGLMHGFYKKEREEVFDRDGFYHTGDRGYLEDGTIWFTGRYSEMIKVSGANVAPLEVEAVLESLPGVAMAFVFGIRDEERGEVVAAVVAPADGVTLDPEELRRQANKELSGFKVPRRWRIIAADDVPRLATGKANKRAMTALF